MGNGQKWDVIQEKIDLKVVLTFIKEVNFEIRDNLGFDVLWDSMSGNRCINIDASLLTWMGYEGPRTMKQNFIDLLDRNDIEYREIGFQDPLIEQNPKRDRKYGSKTPCTEKWIIMVSKNFKIEGPLALFLNPKEGLKK